MPERFAHLEERGTNVKTEVVAGVTTLAAMARILGVSPGIGSASGTDFGKVSAAMAICLLYRPICHKRSIHG